MGRQQRVTTSIVFGALLWAGASSAWAQNIARQNQGSAAAGSVVMDRPEDLIAMALRSNPVTAPYAITARWRNGAVDLSGRVGTKQIHDVAVRTAIAYGFPFRDNLVIDTAMTAQVAANAGMGMGGPSGPMAASVTASSYYVYPPPLFGKLDDPFFGFVPPLVSFPPWWQREGGSAPQARGQASAFNQRAPAAGAGSPRAGWRPLEPPPAQGEVQVTVDSSGHVFLRGVVSSDAVRREVEEMARSVPGVQRLSSELKVQPRRAPDAAVDVSGRGPNADVPPPPPEPVAPAPPAGAERGEPEMVKPRVAPEPANPTRVPTPNGGTPKSAARAGMSSDNQELSRRVLQVIERSDSLQQQAIKIKSEGDVVTLSGKVSTAYEAMLAYRAAQQTPGVRDVIDLLEFTVPDEDHPNPLPRKARPEDLEPYLAAQIRRNVGDLAQIQTLKVRGDILTIQGTVGNDADLDRVLAIVRSIPILHGFRLEATLSTN
jgi:osmotically-inducible protein OsmY